MKWNEFSVLDDPNRLSNIQLELKKNHDYHISNSGFFVEVRDIDGNVIRTGEGTFNTGNQNKVIVYVASVDKLQLTYGTSKMEFAPRSTDYKPATIHVNVPTDAIGKTGLSLMQFGQLVNSITAAGVGAEVLFEGTFSFSDSMQESNYNDEHGFSDIGQTVGGTLGYTYDPSDNKPLPI